MLSHYLIATCAKLSEFELYLLVVMLPLFCATNMTVDVSVYGS